MSQAPYNEWALLDEGGASAIEFTSFIDMDARSEGQALAYPVEEGGFMNYNKIQAPLNLMVTLAVQGDEALFENTLNRLNEYQKEAVLLTVVSPAAFYESMTLESYSYKRARDAGAGLLVVELNLLEVRQVQTLVTTTVITKPKNPSSADNVNTGKTQTEDASIIYDGFNLGGKQ